ncbi:MAG: ferric reductase-like transmembrane domain-containing protein [bacterium]|nr:ferric reductase-like transmembrane domain-containing protein [bacterium]
MKAVHTQYVLANKRSQWVAASVVYLVCFCFFMWYHAVRGKSPSLLTTEKCTAIASVCCLALALAFGPLSRFMPAIVDLLPYRRVLGITAALMSIPHVLLVFIYLPLGFPQEYSPKYPYSWHIDHWFTIVIGFACFVLLLSITAYSYPPGRRRLGERKWLVLQKFAYLAMILVALHLLSMGKIPKNWIQWVEERDYPVPPGSFPTMMVCVSALLLKAIDLAIHGD